ncbi:glutathione peroxidase [Arthrobacter woluwensis]|uniref:glutathione peroxidase n=1 Tax=Arthrobacter woluwensis TaxID=156980 RepID=UPI0027838FC2|nr:glutathione peroxidase [Arthrobacter woluwensis]MDQ0707595.1 glutathione peroxidase [Arthrobacter woluwensis]
MTSLYDIPLTMNDGTGSSFGRFRGNAVLVVNVASKCGFTSQYDGLQRLYERFQDQGLEILGVPCNQFAGQEPGDDAEIAEFCRLNFGVTFPLTAKAKVRGKDQHPLYHELTRFKHPLLPGLIKWNFEKFLISRDGEVLERFGSRTEPDDAELLAAIEAALAAPEGGSAQPAAS